MNLQHERLMALSQALRLEGIAAQWSTLAQKAANEEASFADYLEWLLHAEQTLRTERTRQTLLKLATLPVVKTLEQYDFGFASGAPRSQLQALAMRIPGNLNRDSGICEHHFRKVCGQGFCEQKLSFEGRHLFDSPNKPAAKRSAAVVDPRRWNRTVHLTSEYVH